MTVRNIEAKMSTKVAKYLAEGYTLYTSAMTGSQGEIAKVALTKGDEVVLIYLDNASRDHRSGIALTVKSYKRMERNGFNSFFVYWLREGTLLEEEFFYEVSKEYYVDEEECIAIETVRQSRRGKRTRERTEMDITSDEVKKIVLPFIQRQHLCKTKKLSDIVDVTKAVRTVNGKSVRTYLITLANDKCFALKGRA